MVKKAGVIVGVVIILLAIGVYVLVNAIDSKKYNVDSGDTVSGEVNKKESKKGGIIEGNKGVSSNRDVSDIVLRVVSEDNLGASYGESEEIMVVKKKKMFLIDFNAGEKEGKQLYYAIDLISSEFGILTHFLSEVAYRGINIGDNLFVEYKIFKNDIGVKFPVVIKVTNIE